MSFTDIFIRRPVLASVVSLLILLIGLASAFNLPVRQFPRTSNTTITITTAYPGANADLIKGFITTPIQQAVASAEGIDTLTSSSQQNTSLVTLNLRLDANPGPRGGRRAVQDPAGQERAAARVTGPDRHQADGRALRADVPVLQQQGHQRIADHRLSDARGAAAPADHRRRRQRPDPRRPDVRHAHLAQPGQDGGTWRHAARRAQRASRQQLHQRRRPGEGRLRADHHQRRDGAQQSRRVRQAGGDHARRCADPPQ